MSKIKQSLRRFEHLAFGAQGEGEAAFMDDVHSAQNLQPSRAALAMFYVVAALFIIALLWAAITHIEEITRGQGRVVPSREIQIVQSLEGGILAELLVQEGQKVEKDQVLMRLSDVQFSSEERGAEAKLAGLKAKRARLSAEAVGQAPVMPEDVATTHPEMVKIEMDLYASRKRELDNSMGILEDKINKALADQAETQAQIERLGESARLLNEALAITRKMVEQRAMPKLQQINQERELNDTEGQLKASQERLKSLDADLEVARKEKESQNARFQSLALSEMNDVETQIAGLSEQLKTIGDRVDRAELRAPVAGIVNAIALKTIGGVIEPAMKLVEIVPLDESLKIIARVGPEQVAFLRPGLPAKVKITAYDSHKYGALDGTLARIASNSQTDQEGNVFFEIEVHTARNHLGPENAPLPITPGMVADVDVITGKRSILDYLLKPIFQAQERALTER
ncbi:MAG: HlyD family type I secretion periplasmic adaptor subunit [Alphaproteobacteria bacterium]|nr:HlyD family type I secretion periplasmic adaptor subunit [Alphaproteobacteria bacterium]